MPGSSPEGVFIPPPPPETVLEGTDISQATPDEAETPGLGAATTGHGEREIVKEKEQGNEGQGAKIASFESFGAFQQQQLHGDETTQADEIGDATELPVGRTTRMTNAGAIHSWRGGSSRRAAAS